LHFYEESKKSKHFKLEILAKIDPENFCTTKIPMDTIEGHLNEKKSGLNWTEWAFRNQRTFNDNLTIKILVVSNFVKNLKIWSNYFIWPNLYSYYILSE